MKNDIKIAVVGGDLRQLVCAELFEKSGYELYCYGCAKDDGYSVKRCSTLFECVANARVVLLGIPYSTDGRWLNCPPDDCAVSLKALFELLNPETLVMGGKLDQSIKELAEKKDIKLIDYLDCPDLEIKNAVPTAEGAIEIALRELKITLFGAKALVLGYGKVGSALVKPLCALGAQVSCVARREDARARIEISGAKPISFEELEKAVAESDVIFNTVPHKVLTADILLAIPKDTLIIDLASKPGGVDMAAAKELGLRVRWALSLPGKVAPVSAGKILYDTVTKQLIKEGFT